MSVIRRMVQQRRGEQRDATLSDLMIQRDRLSSTYAGITVNSLTALQNDAYWACVNLLVNVISTLPVETFRDRSGNRAKLETNPPIVERPSGILSRSEWIAQIIHSVVTVGNAYGVIVARDSLGYPLQIELRAKEDVQVTRVGKSGPPLYKVDGKPVDAADMFHVRGLMAPGDIVGIPAIEAMRNTLGVGLASERYIAQWFADGAHPSMILSVDREGITEEQARIIKTRYLAAVRGREPVVLGSGIKVQPVQESPANSQLIEIARFIIERTCRFFGIPPELLGAATSGSSVTYANREQRAIDFVNFAVRPWVTRLEEPWSALLPRGQYVRFDFNDFLRTDMVTRFKAWSEAIRAGWLSPDEARDEEHRPPIPDGKGAVWLWPPYAVAAQYEETHFGAGTSGQG